MNITAITRKNPTTAPTIIAVVFKGTVTIDIGAVDSATARETVFVELTAFNDDVVTMIVVVVITVFLE